MASYQWLSYVHNRGVDPGGGGGAVGVTNIILPPNKFDNLKNPEHVMQE